MSIQNMAYDQQIQKQLTEKSNIMNPKIDYPIGNLNFFDGPDPFFSSDYTITSD